MNTAEFAKPVKIKNIPGYFDVESNACRTGVEVKFQGTGKKGGKKK